MTVPITVDIELGDISELRDGDSDIEVKSEGDFLTVIVIRKNPFSDKPALAFAVNVTTNFIIRVEKIED